MPPKKTESAAPKAKSSSSHGSYQDMITDAIVALKDRNGSSRQSLKKYVKANNTITVTEAMFDSLFNRALKAGVDKGVFEQPKGSSGGTKLAKKKAATAAPKVKKPAAEKKVAAPKAKKVAAAPKAAAAKAKKPAAEKKAAAPKAKKAAAPKKATAPAVIDKPKTLTKTKSGRVAKTTAAPKKAAPKKAAAPKKEKTPKKSAMQ